MVEILPYVDDENEDQFTWIPLSHNGRAVLTSAVTTNTNSSSNSSTVNFEPNNSSSTPRDQLLHSRENFNSKSHDDDDNVFVEDVKEGEENCDNDDSKWRELYAQSKVEELRTDDAQSNPIMIQPWLWGDKLITHITSPIHTKISDSAILSTSSVENTDHDNIVWRRPDELDGDIRGNSHNMSRMQRTEHHSCDIEEEYDDNTLRTRRHVTSLPWAEEDEAHNNDRRWERPSQEQNNRFRQSDVTQQGTSDHDQTPLNDVSSSSTIKSKLHQTLIHDPLRSLPYCFIRHIYSEMKHQTIVTWDAYRQQNDLHTILAPLSLVILVTLWGIVLIATGCTGLVTFIIRSLAQFIWSFYLWLIDYAWRMANQMVWLSASASLLVGGIIWVGMRVAAYLKKCNQNDQNLAFQMPSAAVIIPWIIAVTSPSLVEAIAIVLSVQIFASIVTPQDDKQECLALDGNEHNSFCIAAEMGPDQSDLSFSGMRNVTNLSVALIVALMNILLVSIIANIMEHRRDSLKQDTSVDENAIVKSSSSFETPDSSSAFSRLRLNYDRIQQNIDACHTISVLTFVSLTMILFLVQMLYIHFRTNGSAVIISFINRTGIVGFNVLCIGVGVATLVYTWNFAINVIETNNVLANGISVGGISRQALKKSIVEISSHTVWCKEDMGSSLLGILSDDDGALRYAIFEWIVDRWTASPTPSVGDQSFPPAAEDCDENDVKANAKISHPQFSNENNSANTTKTSTSANYQPVLPSYQSLQTIIAKLDADETLIPTIARYRDWVYSLPPSQNGAMCVAIWKLCPAIFVLIIAALVYIVWTACVGLVTWFSWCVGTSFASSSNASDGCIIFMLSMCTILSPLIFLEYHRAQFWWTCITSYMNRMQSERQSSDAATSGNLSMALLRADPTLDSSKRFIIVNFLPDTSDVFLRIWILLVESISVLESSIPVVRCATIASAAADLTSNSICLVDLALEIKKRGLLCGVGIIVWDAFTYHLSREIEQRKQETSGEDRANARHTTEDCEDLGGKYTGAVVSTVENIGKLSRNIGGLMDQKSASDKRKFDDSDDRTAKVKSTVFRESEQSTTVDEEKEEGKGSHEASSHCDGPNHEPLTSFGSETQQNPRCNVEVCPTQEMVREDTNSDGLMPILIGGGLAIAGAVAGLAVHAAAANKGHKRKDSL